MNKVNVYSNEQIAHINSEFSRITGTCYLDHAGATLYSEKQLESIYSDFSSNIYANPHAHSTSSQSTIDAVDIVRYKILNFFNTSPEEYSVIFTSGATQALKLVAETFDFNGGTLLYLEDNHTSVLGMRKLVPNCREVKVSEAFNTLSQPVNSNTLERSVGNCLFVYPAQSNFAGTKYPLSWLETIKQGGLEKSLIKSHNWYSLLDAACFVSTNRLDLRRYKPDFVTISFYKILGYPTGLGALLVKRSSETVLAKKYLGGGTVLMALSSENTMIPRANFHERFEDGTIPFLSIVSLTHGFDTLRRLQLTTELISLHTFSLAKYTFERMLEIHHSNGEPVAMLYHDSAFDNVAEQGGIVNFNLKRFNGEYVGYAEVLHIANLHGIHLRTGCFCNPGACQRFLRLSVDEVKKHFEAGHVCGDQNDLVDGCPTGSVRISFGYMSNYEDVHRFLIMIERCFVTHPIVRKTRQFSSADYFGVKSAGFLQISISNSVKETDQEIEDLKVRKLKQKHVNGHILKLVSSTEREVTGNLLNIYIYPVKSCAPFEIQGSWKLTDIGLEYDRRWMIINPSGSCVSQKQIKSLCTLKPILDFPNNIMKLRMNDTEIAVPLEPLNSTYSDAFLCDSKVCGDKVQGYDCGDKVAEWLSDNLEKPGLRLLRQCDFTDNVAGRSTKQGEQTLLSLANKAEYLLVNMASVQWLRDRIPQEDAPSHSLESILLRFRANFAVDFGDPFLENELETIMLKGIPFKFSGHCTRCQMICIDQETGEVSKEPLQTLSRELKGKMRFGVYLSQCNPAVDARIETGCSVKAFFKNIQDTESRTLASHQSKFS